MLLNLPGPTMEWAFKRFKFDIEGLYLTGRLPSSATLNPPPDPWAFTPTRIEYPKAFWDSLQVPRYEPATPLVPFSALARLLLDWRP